MDIWMDLLFGNAVGLAGVLTVLATFIIVVTLVAMIFIKANKDKGDE
ncbi:MAG: DUF3149 domain-containing protein [Gammaproteobacteria bacterium]|nr:MAG: DUF3149 domain-containing protein [Gammaproteobacteria bacterium]RTZ60306.1 MAG: DUF3149 domain-containing protein [Gammaproteobacteria bacterium]